MSSKLLLRISSALLLIHALLHTLGHSGWKKSPDPLKQSVIDAMLNNKFPFMGTMRSQGDYFDGYGYCVTIALLILTIILWQISSALSQNTALVKNILFTITGGLLFWAIDEFVFFFPFAAIITLLASAAAFFAAFQLNKQS